MQPLSDQIKNEKNKQNQDGWIYEQIFDAILEQRLAPGTKLAEDALGEIFGVSRTVIRKVLQQLAHEHIVEIRRNRGAIVSAPSVEEARDILEARRLIEDGTTKLACKRITKSQAEKLRALVDEEHACFEREDRSGWIRRSGEFHMKIAEIARNDTMTHYMKELVTRTSLTIAQYETAGNNKNTCTHHDHYALIDAIEAGNEEKACKLMRDHLQACEDKLNLKQEDSIDDLRAIFANIKAPKSAA